VSATTVDATTVDGAPDDGTDDRGDVVAGGGKDVGGTRASSGVGRDDVHAPTVAATTKPEPARRKVRRLRSWVMER